MAERPAGSESTVHLLERARAGDQRAANTLFARHGPALKRWATGRLPKWARDVADTDDLVQETLLQTFRRLDHFEPRGSGSLLAYLRQAVMNRIREELRRKARRPDLTALSGVAAEDGHASPLERAIGQEALDRYERSLAQLSQDDQNAIIGRVELGYSYDELAEILDRPTPDAARKAAERALVRLAELMARAASHTPGVRAGS